MSKTLHQLAADARKVARNSWRQGLPASAEVAELVNELVSIAANQQETIEALTRRIKNLEAEVNPVKLADI